MPRIDTFFTKTMKKTNVLSTAREVIHNKYVLYAVFFAALFDLLYSVVKEDYLYSIIFVLVGFLIAFFNKNMTVILTLTMALSTVLRSILRGNVLKVEGLEGITNLKDDTKGTDATKGKDDKEDEDEKEDKDDTKDSKSNVFNQLLGKTKKDGEKETKDLAAPKPTSVSDAPSKAKLMNNLKEQALDLQEAQKNIINGFEKIEPYMDKAESLIGSIQETALTIQGMRAQGFQSGK